MANKQTITAWKCGPIQFLAPSMCIPVWKVTGMVKPCRSIHILEEESYDWSPDVDTEHIVTRKTKFCLALQEADMIYLIFSSPNPKAVAIAAVDHRISKSAKKVEHGQFWSPMIGGTIPLLPGQPVMRRGHTFSIQHVKPEISSLNYILGLPILSSRGTSTSVFVCLYVRLSLRVISEFPRANAPPTKIRKLNQKFPPKFSTIVIWCK